MDWFTTEDGRYRVEPLTPATFPGALRVIEESFCRDEYLCIGSEVNKNPRAVDELLELCAETALDGVSLVAVETDTGEVTGVAFNKIQVKATEATEKAFFEIFAEERCNDPSSRALVKFMADVDGQVNFFETYNVDCILEIMFLAVLRKHRRNRIGTNLCRESIKVAKRLKHGAIATMKVGDVGPKYSMLKSRKPFTTYPKICSAIWTTGQSQKIGKTLNFKVHLTVPFSEVTYDGKSYSERIGAPVHCEIVAFPLY